MPETFDVPRFLRTFMTSIDVNEKLKSLVQKYETSLTKHPQKIPQIALHSVAIWFLTFINPI